MVFTYFYKGKKYEIDTKIRVKDDRGVLTEVDTLDIMPDRYVIGYGIDRETGEQVVRFSDRKSIFSRPLIDIELGRLLIVIDRQSTIVNPYISINEWSIRRAEKEGNEIILRSLKYPWNIDALPDYIPLHEKNDGILCGRNDTQRGTYHHASLNDSLLIAAAAFIGHMTDKLIKARDTTRGDLLPRSPTENIELNNAEEGTVMKSDQLTSWIESIRRISASG